MWPSCWILVKRMDCVALLVHHVLKRGEPMPAYHEIYAVVCHLTQCFLSFKQPAPRGSKILATYPMQPVELGKEAMEARYQEEKPEPKSLVDLHNLMNYHIPCRSTSHLLKDKANGRPVGSQQTCVAQPQSNMEEARTEPSHSATLVQAMNQWTEKMEKLLGSNAATASPAPAATTAIVSGQVLPPGLAPLPSTTPAAAPEAPPAVPEQALEVLQDQAPAEPRCTDQAMVLDLEEYEQQAMDQLKKNSSGHKKSKGKGRGKGIGKGKAMKGPAASACKATAMQKPGAAAATTKQPIPKKSRQLGCARCRGNGQTGCSSCRNPKFVGQILPTREAWQEYVNAQKRAK